MMRIRIGAFLCLQLVACGGGSSGQPDGGAGGAGGGGMAMGGQVWYRSCEQVEASGARECKEETTHAVSTMFVSQTDRTVMQQIASCNSTKGTGYGGSTSQHCPINLPGCVCSWPVVQGAAPPWGLVDAKYFHYPRPGLDPAVWLSLLAPVKDQCLRTLAGAWTCFGGIEDSASPGSADGGIASGPLTSMCTATYSGGLTLTKACSALVYPNVNGNHVPYLSITSADGAFHFQIDGMSAPAAGTYATATFPMDLEGWGMASAMKGAGGNWILDNHVKTSIDHGQFSLTITAIDGAAGGMQVMRGMLDATYTPVVGTGAAGDLVIHVVAM
jgi:hypothetical protein